MGSSFSVLNDTSEPIWVSVRVCKEVIWGSVAVVTGAVTIGAGGVIACGAVMMGAALFWKGILFSAFIATGVALDRMDTKYQTELEMKSISATINAGSEDSEALARLAPDERQAVTVFQEQLKNRLEGFTRVNQGRSYTERGTLSLVKSVIVIRDDGRLFKRNCWTAPTNGGVNVYDVSKYFENGR